MTRSTTKAALLLAALGAAAGCAHGNQAVRLPWPPRGASPAPAPPPSAPAVSLQRLDDRRPEPRKVVGEIRDWLYFTADLETPDDVAAWATAALRDQLQWAGVRVVEAGAGVPVLGGEVRNVYASGYVHYGGEVKLHAWLRWGDAVSYDALVLGEGTAGLNVAATTVGYAEALASAVRDASGQVATAVAAAAAQGPPGGAAPGPEPGAAIVPAAPAPEEPPLRARAGWYVGWLLSLASVDTSAASGATGFTPGEGQVLPLAGALRLGVPVGRRLLLGGEANVAYVWHVVPEGQPKAGSQDRDLLLWQVLATATFHPLERSALAPGERDVAPRGWYLRGGAGLAFLSSKPDPAAAPPSASWSVKGPALSAGTGWAYWLGRSKTRTIDLEADFSWQFYGSSPSEPERSFSFRLSVGAFLF